MTLGLCPRCPRVLLPLMAWLGTAPCACGAGNALCGRDALEGSGLSCSWILFLVCKAGSALGCAGAWGSPPSISAAESPCLTVLCWDVSPGSQISCSSACPSHAAQPSLDPTAVLSPGARQHRTRHFPLLLQEPSSSGVRQSRRFPCRDYSGSGQPDAKALPAFFAGVVPQHRSGEEEEEEGNARVQKSV